MRFFSTAALHRGVCALSRARTYSTYRRLQTGIGPEAVCLLYTYVCACLCVCMCICRRSYKTTVANHYIYVLSSFPPAVISYTTTSGGDQYI